MKDYCSCPTSALKVLKKDLSVLALVGKKETGKSDIIKNCIVKMLNVYGSIVYPNISKEDYVSNLNNNWYTPSNNTSDIICVMKIKDKTIGFITKGDGVKAIDVDLSKIISYNCDLYVCASHDTTKCISYLKGLTENGNLYMISNFIYNKNYNENYVFEDLQKYFVDKITDTILKIM